MKAILIAFSTVFLAYTCQSQILISILLGDKLNNGKIEFGLDGGYTLSTIEGIDGADYNGSFNLGFYFDIKTKQPNWLFHTGIIVKSTMGAKNIDVYSLNNEALDSAFANGYIARRLPYFNMPLMAKYKISKKVFVEGGIMLGLAYQANDEFRNNVVNEDDLKYSLKIVDQVTRIDAGGIAGIGYRLLGGNGWNIGVRYYYGFVDISVDDSTPNQYNRAFYANVGIPIGVGKPPEKPVE